MHQYHSEKPLIIITQPQQQLIGDNNRIQIVGRLSYFDDFLYIGHENSIDIGRNSSTTTVHFHVGKNNFISRKHFQIKHDPVVNNFFVIVVSKNGIFIDDQFTRKNSNPERLPKRCHFRFPSTDIRILFESFIGTDFDGGRMPKMSLEHQQMMSSTVIGGEIALSAAQAAAIGGSGGGVGANMNGSNNVSGGGSTGGGGAGGGGVYSPLKIKIPKNDKKSPPPSPTGTLSAANSCPTSPRQSFREYHHGYNNNNGYQNDTTAANNSNSNSSACNNEYEKPLYSYAQLIVQSISASPEKQLTLSGIYSFITKHYPYYRKEANKGWQNSIRHNLSLNRYFLKVERSQDEPGKGSFWRIDPNSEAKLIDQSYRKRRQRGSQCFRTPYGMPRSAPASPSHIDNSRDNSPLHDIVLQSAPGSPSNNSFNNPSGGGSGGHHQQQHHQQHQQHLQQQQNGGGGSLGVSVVGQPLPVWPE